MTYAYFSLFKYIVAEHQIFLDLWLLLEKVLWEVIVAYRQSTPKSVCSPVFKQAPLMPRLVHAKMMDPALLL